MKNTEDYRFTAPESLREIVLQEIQDANYDNWEQGKPLRRHDEINDNEIQGILQKVYAHIEKQALAVHKSNEPWALKAWALSNLLRDEVASETNLVIAENLITPVIEWQNEQSFDPISYYKEKLTMERKKDSTIAAYMVTAARFVAMTGRKQEYSDEEVSSHLMWLNKKFPAQSTYSLECQRLIRFLRTLPGGKGRDLPINMPSMPDEFHRPTLTPEDVEKLIWACVTENVDSNLVVRLLVSTIYGARRGELSQLTTDDIHLDGENCTVYIKTKKGGQKKRQPIPQSIAPLFAVPITPMANYELQRSFLSLCKKIDLKLPPRSGFHSIRRRTVTTIAEIESSDINTHNFFRWAVPRQFAMLSLYKQTPTESTDKAILEKHPVVKIWEQAMPYVFLLNDYYANNSLFHIDK